MSAQQRTPARKKSASTRPPQRPAGRDPRSRPRSPKAAAPARAGARAWIGAARIRTLPLAIGPVALGTGSAIAQGGIHPKIAIACLLVALFLQIGVNYANDYSDGIRGTDDVRVGPARLTAGGGVRPRTVITVAFAFFGLAALVGLAIVIATGHYWLLAVGAVCIVAAYFYTGGKRPYGYNAMGELFVFVFFGLVATCGTTYVQLGEVNQLSLFGAVGMGFLACAVLVSNNIRDIEQDKKVGKRTLSVLIGARASKILYTVLVALPMVLPYIFSLLFPPAILVYFVLLLAVPAVLILWTAKTPKEQVLVLKLTSFLGMFYGVGLGWALAIG